MNRRIFLELESAIISNNYQKFEVAIKKAQNERLDIFFLEEAAKGQAVKEESLIKTACVHNQKQMTEELLDFFLSVSKWPFCANTLLPFCRTADFFLLFKKKAVVDDALVLQALVKSSLNNSEFEAVAKTLELQSFLSVDLFKLVPGFADEDDKTMFRFKLLAEHKALLSTKQKNGDTLLHALASLNSGSVIAPIHCVLKAVNVNELGQSKTRRCTARAFRVTLRRRSYSQSAARTFSRATPKKKRRSISVFISCARAF